MKKMPQFMKLGDPINMSIIDSKSHIVLRSMKYGKIKWTF